MKKNLIASLLSVVVLSGCNGKSLNGLTFSDRKKRATIVDKDLDRKQEVKTISRKATSLDSSRYSIYGNIAWQVSDDNSTATIYVINQNISKLTDDALRISSVDSNGNFSQKRSYFFTFGNELNGIDQYIGFVDSTYRLNVYDIKTGDALTYVFLDKFDNSYSPRFELASKKSGSNVMYRLSYEGYPTTKSWYYLSYTDDDGNSATKTISSYDYNDSTSTTSQTDKGLTHLFYEHGFNSGNYLVDNQILDSDYNRLFDRDSPYLGSSHLIAYGDGKVFFYGQEKYNELTKDTRDRVRSYAYALDRNTGKLSFYDNLDFVVSSSSKITLAQEKKKFNGKKYSVCIGSYLCYYPLTKDKTVDQAQLKIGFFDKKPTPSSSRSYDTFIGADKYLVNDNLRYLESNGVCYQRNNNDDRKRRKNRKKIVSLTPNTIIYQSNDDKYHECKVDEDINYDNSASYDYISTHSFNGQRIKANRTNSSSTSRIVYHLNDGADVNPNYFSYLEKGRVVTDYRIYPFNQSKYGYSVASGYKISSVNASLVDTTVNKTEKTKTDTWLYQVTMITDSVSASSGHTTLTPCYLYSESSYYEPEEK